MKIRNKNCKEKNAGGGEQNSIVEKEVIIDVQEVQIDQLNYECNNNNKKIESLKNIITH